MWIFTAALAKSNGITDRALLSIFARHYLDGVFCKIITFEGQTRGNIMLNDFHKFMQEQDLPQKNIVSVAADGVPATK